MSVDHDSIKANDLLVEGKGLYDAGKYEEAVASFDKAIEIKPEFVDVWKSKGDALLELKKYEEAIASYDKAIEADPKDAIASSYLPNSANAIPLNCHARSDFGSISIALS